MESASGGLAVSAKTGHIRFENSTDPGRRPTELTAECWVDSARKFSRRPRATTAQFVKIVPLPIGDRDLLDGEPIRRAQLWDAMFVAIAYDRVGDRPGADCAA